MSRPVSIERLDSVAIITIMNPPVNALSRAVADALQTVWSELDVDRVIITGTGRMFVAGADIREIQSIVNGEIDSDLSYLNLLLNRIESSGRTVVMAMNGGALGIGLELAMAGHYRILKAGTSVGLPEVRLGLIPGAGGTQRLTRLAGADVAAQMILGGNPVVSAEALRLGIVDEVVAGDVVERARQIHSGRRTDQMPARPAAIAPVLSTSQRAPGRAWAAIEAAVRSGTDFMAGLRAEASLFAECLRDPQSRAMIHLFFAERETAKAPAITRETPTLPILETETTGLLTRLVTAGGEVWLRTSPNGRVVEIRYPASMSPSLAATALQHVRSLGKIPIYCRDEEGWLGDPHLSATVAQSLVAGGKALRASDIDVLMVRGFDFPEESGGPLFAYSMTPSHTSEALRDPLK